MPQHAPPVPSSICLYPRHAVPSTHAANAGTRRRGPNPSPALPSSAPRYFPVPSLRTHPNHHHLRHVRVIVRLGHALVRSCSC
eukprot:2772027-Rhodomonas_salina.2